MRYDRYAGSHRHRNGIHRKEMAANLGRRKKFRFRTIILASAALLILLLYAALSLGEWDFR